MKNLDQDAIESLRASPAANNMAQLIAVSKMPREEQQKVALAMGAKKISSVAKARVVVGLDEEKKIDPQAGYVAAANYAVSRMDARHLKIFMAQNGFVHAPAKTNPKEGDK